MFRGAFQEHNPHVETIIDGREVREIPCAYPLIHRSNRTPHHFIHGFIHDLGDLRKMKSCRN